MEKVNGILTMAVMKKISMGAAIILGLLIVTGFGLFYKLASDSRSMIVTLGLQDGQLIPCPASPNCVSSEASADDSHFINAIADPDGSRWAGLVATVNEMDGAELVSAQDNYARFTFTTPLMRFMDDVEFHYLEERGEIAVRSASRVGEGDMNTNRKRVEAIRAALESDE